MRLGNGKMRDVVRADNAQHKIDDSAWGDAAPASVKRERAITNTYKGATVVSMLMSKRPIVGRTDLWPSERATDAEKAYTLEVSSPELDWGALENMPILAGEVRLRIDGGFHQTGESSLRRRVEATRSSLVRVLTNDQLQEVYNLEGLRARSASMLLDQVLNVPLKGD